MAEVIFDVEYRDNLKWLAVDLDDTLAEKVWPLAGVGAPIWRNIHKLIAAHNAGWKIVIHTSRAWNDFELIESWLNSLLIPFDRIVCGKLLAHRYIDDKNVNIDDESWVPV